VAEPALEAQALRKDFGPKTAVRDLTLSLSRGEVFGFLGPNGAGKTTSVKMLLGLVHPTSGVGRLLGEPIGRTRARARVGYLPEHFAFHEWLRGRELLRFHGRLLGLGGPTLETGIEAYHRRVPTRRVNDVIRAAQQAQPGPHGVRVLYATQGATDPPTFTLFANKTIPPHYMRYLERRLREEFDMGATPIKMRVRMRSS